MEKNIESVIIGFYHVPGQNTSTIYAEDTYAYKKEVYKVRGGLDGDEAKLTFKSLKKKYPNSKMVEFRY